MATTLAQIRQEYPDLDVEIERPFDRDALIVTIKDGEFSLTLVVDGILLVRDYDIMTPLVKIMTSTLRYTQAQDRQHRNPGNLDKQERTDT